jgi:hypothetical protein
VTARRGSLRWPLQRTGARGSGSDRGHPRSSDSRDVAVSFGGSWTRRVAPCWLRALPPRRSSGLGVFPVVLDSRSGCPARSSLGVEPVFRVLELRVHPDLPGRHLHPARTRDGAAFGYSGLTSPGVLSPVEHFDAGCPFSPRRIAPPRRTRVAKPSPVPSSGFLPLSTVLAALAARSDPCEVRRSP